MEILEKTACDFMTRGLNIQLAAESAIQLLAERAKALGGVIAGDALGHIDRTHHTPRVAHTDVIARGDIVARI